MYNKFTAIVALAATTTLVVACDSGGGGVGNNNNTQATCGDGVAEGTELCDGADLAGSSCASEGYDFGTLLCSDTCDGFDVVGCADATCGDDIIEGSEACDGSDLDSADCTTVGFDGGTLACGTDCADYDTSGCYACGDGNVDPGEACDDGNVMDGDGCDGSCALESVCGDGVIEGSEVCDDSNTADGDGCSATCLSDETCGNGTTDAATGEECDDGNTADGDGCAANCLSDETCGNGVVDAITGETCDDGNNTAGDGCDASCVLESVCGDGTIEGNEVCDDSNTTAGDGCSANCLSDETCGNGVTDAITGETCDDGNTTAGDGCAADCLSDETCGNGVLDAVTGEQCDDGNTIAGDGCSANCVRECGNGVIDGAEVCDDATLPAGADCVSQGFVGGGTLGCATTCDSFDLSQCVPNTVEVGPGLAVDLSTLADYDGTLATMYCTDIVLALPGTVAGIAVTVGMDHTWIGDLVFRLRSPTGIELTLMNGPGGTGFGDSSNLSAGFPITFVAGGATDAEAMGSTIASGDNVCEADSLCDYFPNPAGDVGTSFADFAGETIAGTWQLCIGDTFPSGDDGTLDYVSLSFPSCGNGLAEPGEACDDGNTAAGDGCSANCTVEPGCGDGILDPALGEECDDGNNVDGDGCEANCTLVCGTGSGAIAAAVSPTDGACFLAFDTPTDWTTAQANCAVLMGNLATVADSAENATLYSLVSIAGASLWIGFTDEAAEGMFIWSSGAPVSYTNWNAGEPNNSGGNENCTALRVADAFWNDGPCPNSFGYLCEL